MAVRVFYLLLGLVAAVLSESVDYAVAAKSISAELSSPTFVAYSKPKQRVEEFIAPGDSYTAGTGCNGLHEIIGGGDAARGKRSFPMQMSTDGDNWDFINGDDTLPRFTFPAYTGDKTDDLVIKQLTKGDYKDGNMNLPRGQPFGKPQLAVMTIGGNDAGLSTALNDCVYRGWRPGDCQETLDTLQKSIDDGTLRDKINYALYSVAHAGREAGGANPKESFQVYVLSYIQFFNEDTTACDEFTWTYWDWYKDPKLTTKLRKQLNAMTVAVNGELKKAAQDLKTMGIILIEDLDSLYTNHRYCESRHTTREMIDYDTWFWSQYAQQDTTSEGPGDPKDGQIPYPADFVSPGQQLLDFVFPGQKKNAYSWPATGNPNSPPWTWPGAEKYPTFESLMAAIQEEGNFSASAGPPFNVLRSFHPKGTAYEAHKTAIFSAISDNRDAFTASSVSSNYAERCKDLDIKSDHLLVGTCTKKDGKEVRSEKDLSLSLRYDNGALISDIVGGFNKDCHGCSLSPASSPDHNTAIKCVCQNDNDKDAKSASLNLDDFLTVQDDGSVLSFGRSKTPVSSHP